jgi:hypothetical protein
MSKPDQRETAAPAVGFPVDCPVGRPVTERATTCTHCGSVACANGGGAMSGYWVIHPGCDEAKAAKEKA